MAAEQIFEKSLPVHEQIANIPDKSALWGDVEHASADYLTAIFTAPGYRIKDNYMINLDVRGKWLTVRDGLRVTPDCPENPRNTVHVFGSSHIFGLGNEDGHTVPGQLQALCNKKYPGRFAVKNHGMRGMLMENAFLMFKTLDLKEGDFVFLFNCFSGLSDAQYVKLARKMHADCQQAGCGFFYVLYPTLTRSRTFSETERLLVRDASARKSAINFRAREKSESGLGPHPTFTQLQYSGCPVLDLQPFFEHPREGGEIFYDANHMAHRGQKQVAHHLDTLIEARESAYMPSDRVLLGSASRAMEGLIHKSLEEHRAISAWARRVRRQAINPGSVGSIVMNCNPFTLGHQYLVERAAQQVDLLYLFLVEEDRSTFPFADRLALVRAGVAHLGGKVAVVPSGRFVLSSMTFPEYFSKDQISYSVDTGLDVFIFGSIIARELGIGCRFAGHEPHCAVTGQYNANMKRLLPLFGVEFVELERRTDKNGLYISASRVRKYLAQGEYDKIRPLVPDSTFDYLLELGDAGRFLPPPSTAALAQASMPA